jgi:FKBP-type peptidyl-prolyl cis-trans isomerase FklB
MVLGTKIAESIIMKFSSTLVSLSFATALATALATVPAIALAKKAKDMKTEKEKVSYILGHQIGSNFQKNGVEVDTTLFMQAVTEAVKGEKSQISPEESQKIMMAYQQVIQAKQAEKSKKVGEENVKEGKTYLEANEKKPGVKKLPSGLQYVVEKEGSGTSPKATDTVKVHYKGTLISGKEFDSSYTRGEPAEFEVGRVIKGWTEALQLMKPGAKWKLTIPSDLAYGAGGAGADIGPNATLLFDVELIEIKPAKTAEKTTEKSTDKTPPK